ncbi:MBL fold metallo-hydrolase [bacterium]|nr:MBL fold metallo-hydrolase [bacterium]
MKPLVLLLLSCLLIPDAIARDMIIALDVGEGQAVLLKHHAEGILVDTGHPGMATHVLRRLNAHRVDTLAYIILTHLHGDHAGGYFRIREAFPEATILHSGQPRPEATSPDLVRWVYQALQQDPRQKQVRAGDNLAWRGFDIRFLWPDRFLNHDLNRHSLVLEIRFGPVTALIMGDAGKETERMLLQEKALKKVQLLMAGHHGAGDTGDEAFLRQVRPGISVISVDRHNIRHYPAAETVRRLQAFSGQLLRTDLDGEVCFTLVPQFEYDPHCRNIP